MLAIEGDEDAALAQVPLESAAVAFSELTCATGVLEPPPCRDILKLIRLFAAERGLTVLSCLNSAERLNVLRALALDKYVADMIFEPTTAVIDFSVLSTQIANAGLCLTNSSSKEQFCDSRDSRRCSLGSIPPSRSGSILFNARIYGQYRHKLRA